MLAVNAASGFGLPAYLQTALFEFLDRGYYDTHLKNLNIELDRRYTLCLDMLRELMPEDVWWTRPGGGPILWIELPRRVSPGKLSEKPKNPYQCKSGMYLRRTASLLFIIVYTYDPPDILRRALEIVAEEIRKAEPPAVKCDGSLSGTCALTGPAC
jgi:DNA-binding transcriptional MocR family regulator